MVTKKTTIVLKGVCKHLWLPNEIEYRQAADDSAYVTVRRVYCAYCLEERRI